MGCYEDLKAVFDRYPRSEFRQAVKRLGRERLAHGDRARRQPLSRAKRLHLYAQQSGRCARCGNSFMLMALTDDHHVPISKGGTNAASNRRLVCKSCNSQKSDADPFTESKRTGQPITQQLGG